MSKSSNTTSETLRDNVIKVLEHRTLDENAAFELIDGYYHAEIQERVKEARESTKHLYDKELEYAKRFQEAVINREAMKIEPIRFCAKCSAELTKEGQ